MKSSVSLCSAILLPVLTLAIPLSQLDASANTQQSVDAANTVNSSALNSPFASAHHMGHGPVVLPSTTSTTLPSSSTGDGANGSTHHRHANRTVVHQTYECDQRVHIEYLIDTVLLDRARGNPGCRQVANVYNRTAHANSSTPSQNLSNPAYIGGGEAAAPPGYQPSASLESSTTTGGNTTDGTTTGGNTTMVAVRIEQSTHGTVTTTTIRIKQHMNPDISPPIPDTPLPTYNDTATPGTPPPMSNTANSPGSPNPNSDAVPPPPDPATRNGTTPYALPPGFTGP